MTASATQVAGKVGASAPANRAQGPSPDFIRRVRERMTWFDRLPVEMRALVNEHGSTIVKACMDVGVRKPNQIAHLVCVFSAVGLYGNGRRAPR